MKLQPKVLDAETDFSFKNFVGVSLAGREKLEGILRRAREERILGDGLVELSCVVLSWSLCMLERERRVGFRKYWGDMT
jgi:hypothetical protein